jgi:radical SAM superfamily enzyme YgiQ (UPF0313 family)
MRIGVLELLNAAVSTPWPQKAYAYVALKQNASIMPQAVSVWCRDLGHEVFYATYYGQSDPKRLLPSDLDLVFISCHTQASPLAYALAKLYRREKTVSVIGGAHSRGFPVDCLRFFDVVVRHCDQRLVADILSAPPVGEIITSGRTLQDIPSVEERMPYIRASTFWRGRPYSFTSIPLLTSTGCPYSCDFCVDWNTRYVPLPLERLESDLHFIMREYPGALVAFHDANFGIKFDQVLDVLEAISHDGRKRYAMECSLSILRPSRLKRIGDVGFVFIAPGVESWTAYSNKAGTGPAVIGREKLDRVVEHFELLREHVPGIQANFIFGLDVDEGDEPVELTKEFITRVPFVWPLICVPTPFGGTPLYDQHLDEGRVLTSMPFAFYWGPYLATKLKNYSPVAYYEKYVQIFEHLTSRTMLASRLRATSGIMRCMHLTRTLGMRQMVGRLRGFIHQMKTDGQFRAFHEGASQTLPRFYHRLYDDLLGPYAALLSEEDRQPLHQRVGHA